MDGILNVYKKKGLTSHDVVNRIRRIFNTKQVGHTGTLDPNAEGVLVVCINQGTKLVQFLECDNKKYRCELVIGFSTDTYDITGMKTEEVENPVINEKQLFEIIKSFEGKYKQKPPMFSAIKIDGKKLYEYARKNEFVDISPREVEIFEITIIDELHKYGEFLAITIDVAVSKGTYIRSLCYDIGTKLGVPTTMGNLLRLKSGRFLLENAKTLEEIENGDYQLTKMVDALDIPKIDIANNIDLLHKVDNGMKISLKSFEIVYDRIALLKDNELLAIYDKYEGDEFRYYKAVRVWK